MRFCSSGIFTFKPTKSRFAISLNKVTRRDFTMSNLLESSQKQSQDTLFGLQPEEKLPVPVRQYSAVSYLALCHSE